MIMMGEMSLDCWDEKMVKENDQNKVDGMKQEVESTDNIEMNDL